MAPVEVNTQRAQVRRNREFHPSTWDDYFISLTFNREMISAWTEEVEGLKKEVRKMIVAATNETSEKLFLIDVIQRQGIAYHFEEEIQDQLQQIYSNISQQHVDDDGGDLSTTALQFRLLRQEGYNISSDVFNKFTDGKGHFNENLSSNVEGLLSLYEASYLRVPGEKILDEALAFTKPYLTSMLDNDNLISPLSDIVSHALEKPIRRSLPLREALFYIPIYQQSEMCVEVILRLAKLNFNLLQKSYQKELKMLTEWWVDMDFAKKMPFARDKLVESYFWGLSGLYQPQFSPVRIMIAKLAYIGTFIDDIYDTHGTIDELELFTDAILRWDTGMKDVPDYMKICFEVVLSIVHEVEEETIKEGTSYYLYYLRESLKNPITAYIKEARWFNEDYVPTLEEYRPVGVGSTWYFMFFVGCACKIGKPTSKEVFDWLFTVPKIVFAAGDHCRLMDDIKTHEAEQEIGHVASAVECYMKQYGVDKEQAHNELDKLAEEDWKIVNEELLLLKSSFVPKPILNIIVNFMRVMHVLYGEFDAFTVSNTWTKEMLKALLVNPMSL